MVSSKASHTLVCSVGSIKISELKFNQDCDWYVNLAWSLFSTNPDVTMNFPFIVSSHELFLQSAFTCNATKRALQSDK